MKRVDHIDYTIVGSTSIPTSYSVLLNVGGLRKLIDGLDDKDEVQIQISADGKEHKFFKSSYNPF